MLVEGRHDTFKIRCKSCQKSKLNRVPAENAFENFRVMCGECGSRASVENDGGIIKVYPIGEAEFETTVC